MTQAASPSPAVRTRLLRVLRTASFASWMLCALSALSASQQPAAEPPATQENELQRMLREGERLWRSGDFKAAREPLEKATSLAEQQGDSPSLARALNLLGNTTWGSGDYSGAISLHQRALELFRSLGKTEDEAKALNNIGNDLNSMGNYQEALKFFNQSLQAAERGGFPFGLALSNIGIVYRYLGRYRDAVAYLERALRLQKEAGEVSGVGLTLNHLGIVSRARGEYDRALDFYRESLEWRRKAGDRRGEAQTLINMGSIYGDLGQPESAISLSVQALTIAEEIGYAAGAGIAQMNIGVEFQHLGRFEEARTRSEAALALFRKINRRTSMADVLLIIGNLRLEARDLDGARLSYSEALDIRRALQEPEKQGWALHSLAALALADNALAEALSRLDEALALARSSRTPELEFTVRADRARALRALGRNQEAFAEFEASGRIVNDLRANLKSDPGKVGFLDQRQAVFTDWAEALLEAGRDEDALEVVEAGRARAIADLLAQRRVRGKAGERQILEQVRTTLDELVAAARTEGSKLRAAASAEGSKMRGTELDAQLRRLRSQNQELASLITVDSPKIKEIKQVAARLGAVIVEYLTSESRLFIWLVLPNGAVKSIRKDVTRKALASSTKRLRREIDEADADALRHPEKVQPLLRELDAALLEPIRFWLPVAAETPLVIVPHGLLWLVPFAALEDAEGRSLAERCTLSFVPSVSIFRYTRSKRAASARLQRALVVADPLPPRGSGLPSLAGSREEATRIQARLGRDRAELLTGAEATEAAVKQRSSQFGILHFATHGLIAEDRPLESSLVLAEGNGEDGYLRVDEIFGLDLKADLVVLSGCSTGLGRLSGDGVLGLTRAFLYAGTRSLVVSQWDVSDRATAFIMDRFYAERGAGRNKAAALRAAQLAAKQQWPHPALWGAFQLVGESR